MSVVTEHKTSFKRKWFNNRNRETFEKHIKPFWAGKSGLTYLELGVFEGMSLLWMLENVLTDPTSRAVGVDPWLITTKLDQDFMDGVMSRAHSNLQPWIDEGRCILQRGNSCEVLRRMHRKNRGGPLHGIEHESLDLCMVDGDHNAYAVYDDAKLVHQLMKPGGWMIFDDVENHIPKKDHVKQGLQMFLDKYKFHKGRAQVKRVFKHKFVECYEKI